MVNDNFSLEIRHIVLVVKGKGYGRECLRLLKHYCFQVLGYHRLWLDVFEDNTRALRLYRSEGFMEEGRLAQAVRLYGRHRSLMVLSILKGEYVPA